MKAAFSKIAKEFLDKLSTEDLHKYLKEARKNGFVKITLKDGTTYTIYTKSGYQNRNNNENNIFNSHNS